MSCQCPALLISAPASGQGKTTVTAALAYLYRQRGLDVRVFKTGPDFLDPMILQQASGHAVYQLDLWMVGETQCRQLLYKAACEAELILIEGVMGLYDGNPSSADLATLFGIPVMAVIDASAMAGTFAAIAHGLASFQKNLPMAGVLANRVGSKSHVDMLRKSLPDYLDWFGALHRDEKITLPDRHLGLLQASEIPDINQKLQHAAMMLEDNGLVKTPAAITFNKPSQTQVEKKLNGIRIGIAQDNAFAFCYQANLDLLNDMGAELIFFSPLKDNTLPEIDSLYLPGGYPELHLHTLEKNKTMLKSIQQHHAAEKPIIAECGGMLYLLESLTDAKNNSANMAAILPGHAKLQKQLVNLSMQSMHLNEGVIRGHSFHHSKIESILEASSMTQTSGKYGKEEAVYRDKKLLASYMHLYMPSNPEATALIFTP